MRDLLPDVLLHRLPAGHRDLLEKRLLHDLPAGNRVLRKGSLLHLLPDRPGDLLSRVLPHGLQALHDHEDGHAQVR
jgi:hypothetical protein